MSVQPVHGPAALPSQCCPALPAASPACTAPACTLLPTASPACILLPTASPACILLPAASPAFTLLPGPAGLGTGGRCHSPGLDSGQGWWPQDPLPRLGVPCPSQQCCCGAGAGLGSWLGSLPGCDGTTSHSASAPSTFHRSQNHRMS